MDQGLYDALCTLHPWVKNIPQEWHLLSDEELTDTGLGQIVPASQELQNYYGLRTGAFHGRLTDEERNARREDQALAKAAAIGEVATYPRWNNLEVARMWNQGVLIGTIIGAEQRRTGYVSRPAVFPTIDVSPDRPEEPEFPEDRYSGAQEPSESTEEQARPSPSEPELVVSTAEAEPPSSREPPSAESAVVPDPYETTTNSEQRAMQLSSRNVLLGGLLLAVIAGAFFIGRGSSSSGVVATDFQPSQTLPSPTLQAVAATTLPSPTPTVTATLGPADTAAGSVLEIGESWRQDGIELQLTSVERKPDALEFYFLLTNRRPDETVFRLRLGDTFSVTNNLGQRLELACPDKEPSFTLKTNEKRDFDRDCYAVVDDAWGWQLAAYGDLTAPNLSELTIRATGISTISEARWRVPITH